jgi:hypothetical protein
MHCALVRQWVTRQAEKHHRSQPTYKLQNYKDLRKLTSCVNTSSGENMMSIACMSASGARRAVAGRPAVMSAACALTINGHMLSNARHIPVCDRQRTSVGC